MEDLLLILQGYFSPKQRGILKCISKTLYHGVFIGRGERVLACMNFSYDAVFQMYLNYIINLQTNTFDLDLSRFQHHDIMTYAIARSFLFRGGISQYISIYINDTKKQEEFLRLKHSVKSFRIFFQSFTRDELLEF